MGILTNLQKAFAYGLKPSPQFAMWIDAVSNYLLPFETLAGPTSGRPTAPIAGQFYFDTSIGQEIWWNGTMWVNSVGAPPFNPLLYGENVFYVDAGQSLTLGATMLATGATPPVATLSGMPSPPLVGLQVDCTLGGLLGVAMVKISTNNGLTFGTPVLASASVPIPGTPTGTISFASGTFTIGDSWVGVISQWSDLSASAANVANPTVLSQPKYLIADCNGLPAVQYSGAQFLSRAATTLGITAASYSTAMVVKFDSNASAMPLTLGDAGGASGFFSPWVITPNLAVRHNPAGDDTTGSAVQTTNYEIIIVTFATGSLPKIRRNGTAVAVAGAVTTLVAPVNSSILNLGSRWNGIDFFFTGKMAAVAIYKNALTIPQCLQIEAGFRQRYALPTV